MLGPRGRGAAMAGIDASLTASIEHLEHRLAIALLLGPKSEQVRWIRAYARSAAQAGLQDRLQELLTRLLGAPPSATQSATNAEAKASTNGQQSLAAFEHSSQSPEEVCLSLISSHDLFVSVWFDWFF